MIRHVFWSGVLAAALATGPASATEAQLTSAKADEAKAQITSITGKVFVNQGAGFVPASGSMALKLGDKVFIGPEASASITYLADNCKIIAPAGVHSVNLLSPCQDKKVEIQPAADLPEQAQAYVAPVPWWLLGIIPVGLCIAFCFEDDDDENTPD